MERLKRNRYKGGETVDMAIKLFGKTIHMPTAKEVLFLDRDESSEDDEKAASNKEDNHEPKSQNEEAPNSSEEEEERSDEQNFSAMKEEKADPGALAAEKELKFDELQNKEGDSSTEKSLKKPDKILPCPRCNSMDTKFCYYNNYNVNQPRHFCRNCQRYWTAGGNMRNVPVGAGRRKSKVSAANRHFCNIRAHDCSDDDLLDSLHYPSSLKSNGRLLSFGPDAALCQSAASVLGPEENKTKKSCNPYEKDQLSGPLASTLNSNNKNNRATNLNFYGFPPYLNGTQLPNPWTNAPPSSLPIPFFPVNAFWGMSWLPPPPPPLISPSFDSSCSMLNSTNLGKHTREGNMLNHNTSANVDSAKSEKCLWIPKTLRIEDSEDAAKCSLWASLGFNKVKEDSKNGGKNGEHKNKWAEEASQLLCANPAALSRSLGFQERF